MRQHLRRGAALGQQPRAAMPSSTPRTSTASAISSTVNARTRKPRDGRRSSRPSFSSSVSAMRSGVRDTPSLAENCSSTTRSPGCKAPESTMSRSSEITLSIWAAMWECAITGERPV
ncbi:hypothetical protein AD428_20050 [Achromobacter sp. DMS1]|nr:hypothetical protein AD428_20050 [Achromobacter sp. DMS1]